MLNEVHFGSCSEPFGFAGINFDQTCHFHSIIRGELCNLAHLTKASSMT